jgi:ABC-type lipoprotein release transport system permease subunit
VLVRTTAGLGLWVRSEWRSGWRSLVGLGLLIAIGGGVTSAAFGGARRADTAFDRFLDQVSSPIDVSAAGIEADLSVYGDAWTNLTEPIADIAGVRGVTPVSWMAVAYEVDGRPSQFFSIATGPPAGDSPPPGSHIIDGRMADPHVADEVTINEEGRRQMGVDIGDRITLRSYASDQYTAFIGSDIEEDRGPRVDVVVTGIHRSAEDISDNPEAMVLLTPAFHDRYGDQIVHCDCSFWIAASRSDADGIAAALPAVIDDYPLAVQEVDGPVRIRVDRSVALEVGALQIAAVVAAVASILVISQALARHVGGNGSTTPALAAIGATRPQIVRGWTVILLPVALLGAIGAVMLATALSPLFPRGLARRAEIDTGVRFDTVALGGGGVVVMIVTVCLSILVAAMATSRRSAVAVRRPRSWGVPVNPPAALGSSFALDPSRDRSRLVAITAIGGLAIAVGGVVAVALVDESTNEVLRTPSAFAADWDLQLTAQPDDPDAVIGATSSNPGVEAFALQFAVTGNQFVVTGPDGTGLVSPQTFQNITGSMGPIIDRGQPAATARDVVLGDTIAESIGADIGDIVTVDAGEQGDQEFIVSGIGRLSDGDETDLAFVTIPDGLTRLQSSDQLAINGAFVRLGNADGASRARLAELGFVPTTPPSRVANLSQIGSVPRLLAVALTVLGIGGATHGLLVASTRRRGDIAVARALGFTPLQAASSVRWQGVVITAAAAGVGVPLGVVVGRLIWKQVATGVGAVDLVSVPWPMILLAPLAALVAMVAIASIVGRRAARLQPAAVLRSE